MPANYEPATSSNQSIVELSDDRLLAAVKEHVAKERRATVALIRLLIELDARRLYLAEGYASLFSYCTQGLHLADGSAYNRIEAARAARRFPIILDALADGALTLTAVRLLSRHLTAENHVALLSAARHKSKRDVELLVAVLAPRPCAATVVRRVPQKTVAVFVPPNRELDSSLSVSPSAIADGAATKGDGAIRTATRNAVTPVGPERYRVHLTISGETYEKLQRVRGLLRHVIPNGDPVAILDRALTRLLSELERRRFAAARSPRPSARCAGKSRYISAAVRRAVWARDEGRCSFVGTDGRCRETEFLEFHHVDPYARGGPPTTNNIQLRCRAHNAYEAKKAFGSDSNEVIRAAARARSSSGIDELSSSSVKGLLADGVPPRRDDEMPP